MPLRGKKIAIIGAGNMGEAILKGLDRAGMLQPDQVIASARHQARLEALAESFRIRTTLNNREAAKGADVIILAVKPQIARGVLEEIAGVVKPEKLVISIVAGLTTRAIGHLLGRPVPVIRTMPNTPALVLEAATAISSGAHATEEHLKLAQELFNTLGKTVLIDEAQMNAVTGLSGSGPAYVFLIIEALADAGVKMGLSRGEAQTLAAQTVLGSAKLLLDTGAHPGFLKDMVTSPGGTAIAGVATLEAGGLRTTLIRAVEVATQRCEELGSKAGD